MAGSTLFLATMLLFVPFPNTATAETRDGFVGIAFMALALSLLCCPTMITALQVASSRFRKGLPSGRRQLIAVEGVVMCLVILATVATKSHDPTVWLPAGLLIAFPLSVLGLLVNGWGPRRAKPGSTAEFG